MSTVSPIPRSQSSNAGNESPQTAVSWAAIFAGAVVALGTTLVLITLAAGLGLTSISPWPNSGAGITAFTIGTGIGLIVVQWLASGMGGYMAGRLRTKWAGVHDHEVFFRDTAHGFLSWAVATIIGTVFLSSAASSLIGSSVHTASTLVGSATQAAASSVSGYDVDALFRSDRPDPTASVQDVSTQATRLLATGLSNGDVPEADKAYLAQLVAARTGIPEAEAQRRVEDTIARIKAAEMKMRQAADASRKAAAAVAIFTALSMLIGAFIASAAAAYAGSARDDW